ncbi:MAG: hypothetical protein K0R38_546 [Polyangiaceae bacterium]|jgi:hypothetical protein|nr:hypothetical protein [Polyangiaceae bacterium]
MVRSAPYFKLSERLRMLLFAMALLGLAAVALSCRGNPTTVMTRLDESRALVTSLRLDFRHVADASNRAVMADRDQTSLAAADESEAATSAVEKHAAELAQLLAGLSYTKEAALLAEFRSRFAEYRELDGRIVMLAVKNTNLKAQWLSFGAANEAVTALASSLVAARSGVPSNELARADLFATQAMLAVRETQVLFAPHIAERDEGRMARMEKQMAESNAKARAALKSLEELARGEAKPSLVEALASLDRFQTVSDEIVALSRRNTNVLSLDLALRDKPPLVAACTTPLEALQAALAKEGPKSTR